MFSKDLEVTIGHCYKQAREQRHEFMTVEHLLLALTENQSALGALRACGADLPRLSAELERIIAETVPVLPHGDERDTQPTLGFAKLKRTTPSPCSVLRHWCTPMKCSSSTVQPVSSSVSRTAASARLSPSSRWPAGWL